MMESLTFLLERWSVVEREWEWTSLMVVLNPKVRDRIVWNAHDEAGHRGRDPTFQKIHDSYW